MSTIELHAAYLQTTYWVEARPQPLALRIDQRSRQLDRMLGECGASRWAFVTACNPRSELRPHCYNAARQRALLRVLRGSGWDWLHAVAQGDDWPAEPGVLVPGMGRTQARRLGRRFRQHAVVVGERGKPAELVWCGKDREAREVTQALR